MGRLSSDFPNAQAVDAALKRANKAEVDVVNLTTAMAGKVDYSTYQTETQNLQGQIDQIVISASAESVVAPEVVAARVDSTGVTHETLKARIDYDEVKLGGGISGVNGAVNEIKELLTVSESVNQFPPINNIVTGGYLSGGEVVESTIYGYTEDYIPIEGGITYTIGIVPTYGSAVNPWMACPIAVEFYDSAKTYIGDFAKGSNTFTFPYNARYIRVNCATSNGINKTLINSRAMLVKGNAIPVSYSAYSETVYITDKIDNLSDDIQAIQSSVDDIKDEIYYVSTNLYDSSLQTPETISPHYYVNGVPYSSTAFDTSFHCTALIPVEPSTTYTVALVPEIHDFNKPWGGANAGGFCYDTNGEYISGSSFKTNTFTTPANAKYIRFNYELNYVKLTGLNANCMIVKGSSIPETYEPYYDTNVKTVIAEIEDNITSLESQIKTNYIIDQDGNGVTLISKYSNTHDIAINIKKKGGNNLVDFYSFSLIPNSNKNISKTLNGAVAFLTTTTDWHAPFVVGAKENIDGDDTSNHTFTGGNHQYNNQGSGSTATARTTVLKFFADNREVTSGSDGCSKFEIIWVNLVQGYNTKKVDGSGREILQENHRLVFDGDKFESYVDLIPLENITMEQWYGLQWTFNPYPNTRYIGAANRLLYDSASESSSSGDNKCNHVVGYGDNHEIRIDIDPNYDLGDRKYYSGTSGAFTLTYGKGYYYIISNADLEENAMYSLHGTYQFAARKEVAASNITE